MKCNFPDQESTIERHVSDHNTSKPPRIPQSKETLFSETHIFQRISNF